jgi:hypothetical protein
MIKVTNDKGAWNVNADDLMRQVLGHDMDKRIEVSVRHSGWGGISPLQATKLYLETKGVVYPPIHRIVNVVKGEVDGKKVKAKYEELLAMLPALETARAERQVAYNQEVLKRAENDLATVEEYSGALGYLPMFPRVKALVEYKLDQERHYIYADDGTREETNEEMLVRLRLELELARQKVEGN